VIGKLLHTQKTNKKHKRAHAHTHTHRLPHQAPSQQSNVEEEEENVRPKKIRRCYGKYNREDND
jgi:hypothetical protein